MVYKKVFLGLLMKKHLETKIGVYAFIIKDKKVLFLRKPNDRIWCALGGRMDTTDSHPLTTLEREAKEEIGSEIIIGDILDIKLWSTDDQNHRLGIFYVCTLKDTAKELTLSEEHDSYKFFTFDEGIDMLSLEPVCYLTVIK